MGKKIRAFVLCGLLAALCGTAAYAEEYNGVQIVESDEQPTDSALVIVYDYNPDAVEESFDIEEPGGNSTDPVTTDTPGEQDVSGPTNETTPAVAGTTQEVSEEIAEDESAVVLPFTFDAVRGALLALGILAIVGAVIFSRASRRRRKVSAAFLITLLAIAAPITIAALSGSADSMAAQKRYVAGVDSLNLYSIIKRNSLGVSGTVSDPLGYRADRRNGVYMYPGTQNDQYPIYFNSIGPIGIVEEDAENDHSNVIFAGLCWRVIRTTESGGVKLLYNGKKTERDTCEGDEVYGYARTIDEIDDVDELNLGLTSADVPSKYGLSYMYNSEFASLEQDFQTSDFTNDNYLDNYPDDTDSAAKITIDNWFKKNLLAYQDKLADDIFCSDRRVVDSQNSSNPPYGVNLKYASVERYGTKRQEWRPTLDCLKRDSYTVNNSDGNQKLTYPVGLISMDEAMLLSSSTANHDGRYSGRLSTITSTPAMAPTGSGRSATDTEAYRYSPNLSTVGKSYTFLYGNVLPVVSLANSVKIATGNGSVFHPYIVDGEEESNYVPSEKTLTISDGNLYDYLKYRLTYTDLAAERYDALFDDEAMTITIDTNLVRKLDLSYGQIQDADVLANFNRIKHIDLGHNELETAPSFDNPTYYDLTDNQLTKLPAIRKMESYADYMVGGNKIRNLSPILSITEDAENFRQEINLEYADPQSVSVPPVLGQYIEFLAKENPDSEITVRTFNIEFTEDFSKARVGDVELPSAVWMEVESTPMINY